MLSFFMGIGQCSDWDKLIAIPDLLINDAIRDTYGNLYVVGSINRTVQVGSVTLPFDNSINGFILKLDKSQIAVWGRSVANGQNGIEKVAIDKIGNVVVSGYFYSPFIDWDCFRLYNTNSRSDVFLAKLSPSGTTIWAKSFAGSNDDYSVSLEIAPNNDIVLAGVLFSPALQIGGVTIVNRGGIDSFVAKLDEFGNTIWAKDIGGSAPGNFPDYIRDVALDTKGNVVIGGWFESPTLQIDNFFFNATAISLNYFIAKIDLTGKVLWAKGPEVVLNYGIEGLAIDADDNIYATGNYNDGIASFDGITLANSGDADIFLVKYSHDGIVQWAKGMGGQRYETGSKLAVDGLGHIYLAGYFYSYAINIGSDNFLKSEFQADMFLSKVTSDGSILCSKRTRGDADDIPFSLFTDVNNNVFLFSQKLIFGDVYFDNVFASTDPAVTGLLIQLGKNDSFPDDPSSISAEKIDLGRDTTLCPGTKMTLNAGDFCKAAYLWSTNSTTPTIQVANSGIYWVEVTFKGALLRDTIRIDYHPSLIFDLGKDIEKCYFNRVNLSIPILPATTLWNDGTTGFQKQVSDPGLYWVAVKNKCEQRTDSIRITNFPRLTLDLGQDRRLCDSVSIVLKTNIDGATYGWSNGGRESTNQISESGIYWVTVTDFCETATDSVKVDFVIPSKLFFPNVITPNGDDKNDFFEVDQSILGSEFEVFNRWGQSVFYAKAYQNNWNAQGLTTGNYFYLLKENCKNTNVRGIISVLR